MPFCEMLATQTSRGKRSFLGLVLAAGVAPDAERTPAHTPNPAPKDAVCRKLRRVAGFAGHRSIVILPYVVFAPSTPLPLSKGIFPRLTRSRKATVAMSGSMRLRRRLPAPG